MQGCIAVALGQKRVTIEIRQTSPRQLTRMPRNGSGTMMMGCVIGLGAGNCICGYSGHWGAELWLERPGIVHSDSEPVSGMPSG